MTDEPMVERLEAIAVRLADAETTPYGLAAAIAEARAIRRWWEHDGDEVDYYLTTLLPPEGVQGFYRFLGHAAEDIDFLLSQLREQRERAERAEALVRAKQSWIDGMKVDYDALNDEANTWRQRAEEAEECIATPVKMPRWDADPVVLQNGWNTPEKCGNCGEPNPNLAAAERTVKEQREVIEAARGLVDELSYNRAYWTPAEEHLESALTALAPDTEGTDDGA